MLLSIGGVIKPIMKLHIQFADVLIDMAFARVRNGKISEPYTHPIGLNYREQKKWVSIEFFFYLCNIKKPTPMNKQSLQ